MAAYDVKIVSDSAKEILLNKDISTGGEAIDKVIFKMNTIDNNTLNRSSAVRCELIIEGKINKQTKEETMKLAKWAMAGSGDSLLYREVTVAVFTDESREEFLRQYSVDKMFCIDYDEIFEKDPRTQNEAGKFVLHLAQREGAHTKDVFAN